MERALTHSVINNLDDEYISYPAVEENDVLFGAHSIDYVDFNKALFEMIGFLDSYKLLSKDKLSFTT